MRSSKFQSSPRLISFLSFVVEATLAGQGDRLKGYTIGVEALDRPASFDPQTDPIVRVEAVRLRRALAQYYREEGASDPIVLELPPGNYAPTFRSRCTRGQSAKTAAPHFVPWSPAVSLYCKRAIVFALAVLATASVIQLPPLLHSAPNPAAVSPGSANRTSMRANSPLPVVQVEPFDILGPAHSSQIWLADLRRRMRDAFAQFDEIVVAADPPRDPPAAGANPLPAFVAPHIDFRITGMIELHDDETITPTIRLIDADGGTIVWTRTFERSRWHLREQQEYLVRRTVTTIAQANGVIQARARASRFFGTPTDSRYACLLDHNEYRQSYNPADHEPVRACLTKAISGDPNFSLGFALLGRLQVRHHAYQFGNADGEPRPLDRALHLVRRAVEIDSESPTAYLSLMIVHLARREMDAAWAAADRAVSLNPHDMLIRADYGLALLRSGRLERGKEMLDEAMTHGHLITPRISFAQFLLAYLGGDVDAAQRHLDLITSSTYPLGIMAQALVAAKTGQEVQAQQAVKKLAALQPNWLANPRRELSKVLVADHIVDRLTDDLRAIGVAAAR